MKKRSSAPIVAAAVIALSASVGAMARTATPHRHAQDPQREARLRVQFGAEILIDEDGNVTKRYHLAKESRRALAKLLTPVQGTELTMPRAGTRYGGPEPRTVLGRMLGDAHWVEIVYLDDLQHESSRRTRAAEDTAHALLLIKARPAALQHFEAVLNFMCTSAPQVEVEVRVVEYRTKDSKSPGAAEGDTEASEEKGQSASADVVTQQKVVVRDGGVASIATHQSQPTPEPTATQQAEATPEPRPRDIGTTMEVRAEIVGTETVVLDLNIRSVVVVGFAPTGLLPTPILAVRELATSVQTKDGHTLVIGGQQEKATLGSAGPIPDDDTPDGSDPDPRRIIMTNMRSESAIEFHVTPRIVTDASAPAGR